MFRDEGTIMPVWKISRVDPGFLYVVENQGRYKIGKSKQTITRLRAARTWLPDMKIIGIKPFWGVSYHEKCLHVGFANYWYDGEWYDFRSDEYVHEMFIEGFVTFSNESPDRNSVDFIYWFNGEGMSEFVMERAHQDVSVSKFRKNESDVQKSRFKT